MKIIKTIICQKCKKEVEIFPTVAVNLFRFKCLNQIKVIKNRKEVPETCGYEGFIRVDK